MGIKKHIPNVLTLSNLACGCIGITLSFNGQLAEAVYLIWLAMVFDFFDGFAARILKVSSAIGKELDSLADMVSFGVLPSILLFHLIGENGYLPYFAFLIALFSALRLAKFNIDDNQEVDFIGLPTPANALFISALVFVADHPDFNNLLTPYSLVAIAIIFSLLLVAPIRLFSLKIKSKKLRENKTKIAFVSLTVALLSWFGVIGLPLVIILYICMSIIRNMATSN